MKDTIERFWSSVDVTDEDGCWIWKNRPMSDGYGSFRVAGKNYRAHRYAYFLATWCMPASQVLHACDMKLCVNPAHLSQGTHEQNMREAAERSRVPRGEASARSKITRTEALAIRGSSDTAPVLAQRYGVSTYNIYSIKNRRTWKHV